MVILPFLIYFSLTITAYLCKYELLSRKYSSQGLYAKGKKHSGTSFFHKQIDMNLYCHHGEKKSFWMSLEEIMTESFLNTKNEVEHHIEIFETEMIEVEEESEEATKVFETFDLRIWHLGMKIAKCYELTLFIDPENFVFKDEFSYINEVDAQPGHPLLDLEPRLSLFGKPKYYTDMLGLHAFCPDYYRFESRYIFTGGEIISAQKHTTNSEDCTDSHVQRKLLVVPFSSRTRIVNPSKEIESTENQQQMPEKRSENNYLQEQNSIKDETNQLKPHYLTPSNSKCSVKPPPGFEPSVETPSKNQQQIISIYLFPFTSLYYGPAGHNAIWPEGSRIYHLGENHPFF